MYEGILDIEASLEFADEATLCTWLSIRNTVLRDFESQRSGLSANFSFHTDYNIIKKIKLAIYFFPDVIHLCVRNLTCENLLIHTGQNTSAIDESVDAFGAYLTKHGSNYLSMSFGRSKLDADFSFYSIVVISNLIAGLISIFLPGKYFHRIENLLATFDGQSGFECRVPLRYLARKYLANKILTKCLQIVLGRSLKNIKAVYLEEGHYQDKSQIVHMLKKHGLSVIEQQHGMVHLNHDAYNYPDKLFEDYKGFLPDRFLVFDDFWKDLVRIPGNIENIGWYKLGEYKKLYLTISRENRCLFIGSGLHTKDSISAFNKLRSLHTNLKFYYRPHPSEKQIVQKLLDSNCVDIFPLHKSLLVSRYVVGDMSTVLFEAQEMGCKVMGLKSPYLEGTGLDSLLPFCELAELTTSNFFER